jgi:hypothetical protein
LASAVEVAKVAVVAVGTLKTRFNKAEVGISYGGDEGTVVAIGTLESCSFKRLGSAVVMPMRQWWL